MCFVLLLSSCTTSVIKYEITTSKKGSIDVTLLTKSNDYRLTPLVKRTGSSITDDGKGLYLIDLKQEGEGTVSISSMQVAAGSEVTINAVPAEEWKIKGYVIDNQLKDSNKFIMPEKNIEVKVLFISKRHTIGIDNAYYNQVYFDLTGNEGSGIENEICYFSITEEVANDGYHRQKTKNKQTKNW